MDASWFELEATELWWVCRGVQVRCGLNADCKMILGVFIAHISRLFSKIGWLLRRLRLAISRSDSRRIHWPSIPVLVDELSTTTPRYCMDECDDSNLTPRRYIDTGRLLRRSRTVALAQTFLRAPAIDTRFSIPTAMDSTISKSTRQQEHPLEA